MLEFLQSYPDDDAIELIKQDHETIRALFKEFKNSEENAKKTIAENAMWELRLHTVLEEKIFYPYVREHLEQHMMTEADEEHHEQKLLVAELAQMTGRENHWWAKFHVLTENVEHHFKEEEEKMFPKARKLDLDFSEIGQKMLEKKAELINNGVEETAEDKMVEKAGIADSSAQNARIKK